MKANTEQHKQYLINSISEMELFINKVIGNIYDRKDTITEPALNIYYRIINRKKENIRQFEQLLRDQYNHTF